MNIEFRIAKLERLLSDVSVRRAQVRMATPGTRRRESAVAGWDSLERSFQTVLGSLKQQRDVPEIGSAKEIG